MELPYVSPVSKKIFTLNNGINMPRVGLGTFRMYQSALIMQAVDEALKAGYRLFDTAASYGNESALGAALSILLPKYNLEREDVFIITKLSPADHGTYEMVKHAYEKSLQNLRMDYVDLYLIHFPSSTKLSNHDSRNAKLRESTWQAMTRLYDEGRVNSIGVSNFTVKHLIDLNIRGNGVCPVVNQVEWHPYYYQEELLAYCRQRDICLQAYCSLGGASHEDRALLLEPAVVSAAEGHAASAAQVLLAWALQRDVAVIPKSASAQRIRENIDVDFTLTGAELRAIDALGERRRKYAWDPAGVC